MLSPSMRRVRLLGFLLVAASAAPVPADPRPSALAVARHRAALQQFEEVWTYYRQSRTESFPVYYWSRLVLDSEREMRDGAESRVASLEGHLARMQRLEALVNRVRRLGFGFSIDVGAARYYRLEAEHWLERERSK